MARRFKRPNNRREDTRSQFRTNRQIRALEVRVVGNNLGEISKKYGQPVEPGIYPTRQAVSIAEAVEMDLVEISPKAKPPVVRIVDFSKFLYEKKKKEKEIKSKAVKTVVKEIRFGPNTDEHDFQFKLKHAQNFLEDGAKVKAYVQFKGRTIVFKERGKLLLLKFLAELEEFGSAEALPRMEGRRMFVFVAPKKVKKKVTSKKSKGSKKTAAKKVETAKKVEEPKKVEAAKKVEAVKEPAETKKVETPIKK